MGEWCKFVQDLVNQNSCLVLDSLRHMQPVEADKHVGYVVAPLRSAPTVLINVKNFWEMFAFKWHIIEFVCIAQKYSTVCSFVTVSASKP